MIWVTQNIKSGGKTYNKLVVFLHPFHTFQIQIWLISNLTPESESYSSFSRTFLFAPTSLYLALKTHSLFLVSLSLLHHLILFDPSSQLPSRPFSSLSSCPYYSLLHRILPFYIPTIIQDYFFTSPFALPPSLPLFLIFLLSIIFPSPPCHPSFFLSLPPPHLLPSPLFPSLPSSPPPPLFFIILLLLLLSILLPLLPSSPSSYLHRYERYPLHPLAIGSSWFRKTRKQFNYSP